MADNFQFDIAGAPLGLALDVAFSGSSVPRATGWSVDKDGKRLILYSGYSASATRFPTPLPKDGVVALVRSWLDSIDYGIKPDNDGDSEKGSRVYTEAWGMVNGGWQAFVAIEPYWLMYGK